ncbi:MAG: AAA family ATPase [Gammaproteobacteria bacterium]|nr:AAA family ATPase [Gammaproteobacteria bacterium]MYJ74310.1 AAA family ATPase [Gammaproteobacteria bacterium]
MSRLQFREIRVENYRCFETLTLSLEEDTTVLFAENGGGKTALLAALAMGLSAIQMGTPQALKLDRYRDPRMRTLDDGGRREPVGTCEITWTAQVGEEEVATWSATADPRAGRVSNKRKPILDALERVRVPGERWPLYAWYGVDRLGRSRPGRSKIVRTGDRWEAYESSLDPILDEAPLLQWLQDEMLGDVARRQQGEPERFLYTAVMEAVASATRGVENAWYDAAAQGPMVRFDDGHVAPWSELSDGYHVYGALVADIARRAVMLNQFDAGDAPARVEGVILIDELDLHLHPRWQRMALAGLRAVFPRLQLIVTTHSPQVLSSFENRQVRRLSHGKLQREDVLVEDRDTNSILREYMLTDDRTDKGIRALDELHDLIDRGCREEAEELYRRLRFRWGDLDPDLIQARALMED